MKKEMKTTTDISKLIARKILDDTLAPEEEAALQAWLSDGRNAATYEEVKRLDLVSAMLRLEREDYGCFCAVLPCGPVWQQSWPCCSWLCPVLHGVSRATTHSRRR